MLKKQYKFVPPPVETEDKADENGITDSMLFDIVEPRCVLAHRLWTLEY